MLNFIDNNEVYQLYAEGKLCLNCNHEAHCGQSCTNEEDECDCFECGCINCKNENKQHIGPTNV
jgi:hypothetical protein